jgi:hypothetical protein
VASQHEEELLVCGRVALVVLVDDQVARGMGRPGGGTEGRNAEVVPDRPIETAPVGQLVDLIQMRNSVTSHETPFRRGPSPPWSVYRAASPNEYATHG